jgi:two-component system cell cycle response regulator
MHLMDPLRYQGIKACGRLPAPHGVAQAILQLLRREDYRVSELVRLLKSDPTTATRLVKFANTTLGTAGSVAAVTQAVQLLGAFRVRDLVLAFSVLQWGRDQPCGSEDCRVFDREMFWSRSLATAVANLALAPYAQIAPEEAFALGLLNDVGRLALACFDCRRFAQAQHMSASTGASMVQAEHQFLGVEHRELGAALLAEWGLPETLVLATYYAEDPDGSGFEDGSRNQNLILALHFARSLADFCVAREAQRWDLLPSLYGTASRLGITPDELTALADGIVHRWHDWGAALDIRTVDLPRFAELAAAVPTPAAHPAGGSSPAPRRAVYIGAAAAEASALRTALDPLGYDVRWVASGVDGLMVVLRDSPDVVFMDIDSPELDGESFCEAFRDHPPQPRPYLILVGAENAEARLEPLVSVGADDFLLRPLSTAAWRAHARAANKIGQLRDIIQRERRGLMHSASQWAGSQRRIMAVALTDCLTQLPNRRRGLDDLAAEWTFARDLGRPLSCLMVDIDYFKSINDQYGHDTGDVVLARVARMLADCCRQDDIAFRYGGEEFCVVCANTDLETAQVIAERMRGTVERYGRDCLAADRTVTISIGVAALASEHRDAQALLSAADAALLRAKANGRNRIEA